MPRVKKQQEVQPEATTPKKKKTAAKKSAAAKVKKVDGRTVEGKLQKMQADYEKVSKKYEELCKHYAELKVEQETMLSTVKTLEMLLASFNALTCKGEVKMMKPKKGTSYWYIRAMATVKSFEVVTCSWNDWTSDHYRYVKGNMFLDQKTANTACQAMNMMLSKLNH